MADDITFQSTTLATPAAGVVAAADEVAGKHYQRVKITDGTADSTNHLVVDSGGRIVTKISDGNDTMLVNADGSINVSGSFSTSTDRVTATASTTNLTTATTLYAGGDVLGGQLSLASMAATSGGGGYISSMTLLSDKISVIGPVRAWFFSASVTAASDNAAISFSDADMASCVGTVTFPSPAGATNNAIATVTDVNLDYECAVTTLYVVLETLTTHTIHFDATDDLHLTVRAIRL